MLECSGKAPEHILVPDIIKSLLVLAAVLGHSLALPHPQAMDLSWTAQPSIWVAKLHIHNGPLPTVKASQDDDHSNI